MGEGEYLDFCSDFLNLLEVILDYYPNDTYIGTVSDKMVKLRHVCDAESQSNIDVNIVGIDVDISANNYSGRKFVFTLELTSETDQNVTIYYTNSQVGCIAILDTEKKISLKSGVPQTVTLEYTASSRSAMKVKVGNCIVEIR